MFIRPTFNGYLRELDGKEDPYLNWKKRSESFINDKDHEKRIDNKDDKFSFKDLLKNISLEIRIKVAIEAYFISKYGGSLIMPLDENGNDIPEVVEKNIKCLEKANPIINIVLDEIKKWKNNGCP